MRQVVDRCVVRVTAFVAALPYRRRVDSEAPSWRIVVREFRRGRTGCRFHAERTRGRPMKKVLLSIAITAGLAGSAFAADLPAKAPRIMPAPVAAANWTGCFVGAG